MRIGLVIYHLGRGGAEKIALSMANWWVAAGYRVCILVLSDKREPAYPLADGVTVRYLDVAGRSRGRGEAVAANLRRLLVLRSAIRESRLDVVIGFMGSTNVLTALAAFGTAPVILSEHTDPVACPMGRAWGVLRAIAYPLAAKVTVQTMRSLGRYPARLQRNMTVIPNVIEVPE